MRIVLYSTNFCSKFDKISLGCWFLPTWNRLFFHARPHCRWFLKILPKNPPISVNVCLFSLLVLDDMLYVLYSMNLCSKLGNRITWCCVELVSSSDLTSRDHWYYIAWKPMHFNPYFSSSTVYQGCNCKWMSYDQFRSYMLQTPNWRHYVFDLFVCLCVYAWKGHSPTGLPSSSVLMLVMWHVNAFHFLF